MLLWEFVKVSEVVFLSENGVPGPSREYRISSVVVCRLAIASAAGKLLHEYCDTLALPGLTRILLVRKCSKLFSSCLSTCGKLCRLGHMPSFPLSRDGRCPSCGTADVAYVLLNRFAIVVACQTFWWEILTEGLHLLWCRHFAAGTLAPIFRILLKSQRAVVGLEQTMMTVVCMYACMLLEQRLHGEELKISNLCWRARKMLLRCWKCVTFKEIRAVDSVGGFTGN